MTAVLGYQWFGILPEDITWSNEIIIGGDLIVPKNKTLTILPGTTIKFSGKYSITVNDGAKIIAEGISSQPIRFTSVSGSSPGSWYDIRLNGGNSVFKHCIFEYGRYPIRLENATSGATTLIENCEMKNSTYGIYCKRSKAKVKSCNLHHNTHGVFSYNSTRLDFTATKIYQNTSRGVYSYSSGLVQFYGSVIENNGDYGVYVLNSDVINIGNPYTWQGWNTVRFNGNNEVHAGSGSPIVRICYSSVHDNSGLEVYNKAGNPSVYTLEGFWDTNGCQKEGNVVLDQPYHSLPSWDGQTRTGGPLGKTFEGGMPGSEEDRIEELKQIIAGRPGGDESEGALVELYGILRGDYVEDRLGEKEAFYGYLEGLYGRHGDKKLGKRALRYRIIWDILEGRDDRVIALSKKALKELDNKEHGFLLLDLAYAYLRRGLSDRARDCLLSLRARPEIEAEMLLRLEEDIHETDELIAKGLIQPDEALPDEIEKDRPERLSLLHNYPNPANPTTTIVYTLPEASDVLIRVFDVRGRLVKMLVHAAQDAGRHTVVWDGADGGGLPVSSGMYFCRLEAGDTALTRKMLLVR